MKTSDLAIQKVIVLCLLQDPSDWDVVFTKTCERYGFVNHPAFSATTQNRGKVLVYNQSTLRLVGGEREFSKEIFAKFGVCCDMTKSMLEDVAKENLYLFLNDAVALKVRFSRIFHLHMMFVILVPFNNLTSICRIEKTRKKRDWQKWSLFFIFYSMLSNKIHTNNTFRNVSE